MFKKAKKALALFLAVLCVMSVFSVAVSAAEEEYATIFYKGYGSPIYVDKNDYSSEQIYPTGVDAVEKVKEALVPCLAELALGSLTNDYDSYCDALYNSMAPIYEDLILSPDGTVKDNSGRQHNFNKTITNPGKDTFDREVYVYYDWRLSPITLAEELDAIITQVIDGTKKDKVNIVGRCYGSNIISAYLEMYKDDEARMERINKVVFYVPSTEGIGLVGAIFSGKLEINAEYIDDYCNELMQYVNVMEEGLVKDFISVMLSVFEQATILELGTEKLQALIDAIKDNLIPRLVRSSYGSFPSFWSMVPDEYFADAVDFVYNTDELKEEYEGTIDLITRYHDNVQVNSRETVKTLEDAKTIDFAVVSKYNLPSAPLMGEGNKNSDAVAETYYTSFGATVADYGMTLGEEYIANMDADRKLFLSADEKIDASTCTLPMKTWFIKNNYHDHFPTSIDELINTILNNNGMDVFTYAEYPQFLDAEIKGEDLTEVEGKDNDITSSTDPDAAKVQLLIKFITVAIKALTKLIEWVVANYNA